MQFNSKRPEFDDRALLVRCPDCDLLQRVGHLPPEASADCPRCGATLFAHKLHGFERAFVLYLSALLLLLIANAFPFLTLKVQGQVQSSHLISGAIDLYRHGMPEVALAVVLFVVVFPLLKIAIGLIVVGPLTFGRKLPGAEAVYRVFDALHPWAMMEIFLLGVLVAYTKLVDLATVEIGPSSIAFIGLILAMIAADSAVDRTMSGNGSIVRRVFLLPAGTKAVDWSGVIVASSSVSYRSDPRKVIRRVRAAARPCIAASRTALTGLGHY